MAIRGYIWIKEGAVVDRFRKPITHAKGLVAQLFFSHNEDLYIKSGREGNHGANSLHYVDLAFDIGYPQDFLIAEIMKVLGKDYDVIAHARHIHIEYDPK